MPEKTRLTWRRVLRDGVLLYAALAGLRLFVVDLFFVPSGSMRPTLTAGDYVLVNRLAYRADRVPERGDVIVFRHPDDPTHIMVKRVVGLPGDRIAAAGAGYLSLNGSPTERRPAEADPGRWEECLSERRCHDILDHPPSKAAAPGAATVADRHLYVLGDDRRGSIDSRNGWQVPVRNVLGRVVRVAWSIDPADSGLPDWLARWRLTRTGLAVR